MISLSITYVQEYKQQIHKHEAIISSLKEEIHSLHNRNASLDKELQTLKNTSQSSPELFLINFSNFQIFKDSVLGKGTFGKVYKGAYYKMPVAVKKLKTSHTPQARDDFKNEIQTLM